MTNTAKAKVAIGTGRNLPRYLADVTITGIELSPAMLAIARQRAATLGLDADLREGDAEHLPFDDTSFDTSAAPGRPSAPARGYWSASTRSSPPRQ